MVAYRFALLSAAALSTFGIDAANGAFLGRYDRRQIPRDNGSVELSQSTTSASSTTTTTSAKPPPVPPVKPVKPTSTTTAAAEVVAQSTLVSFDLGVAGPSTTVIGGGGLVQFVSSSSISSSTTSDYLDPNDYGTSGTLSPQSMTVPTRTSAPSKPSVVLNSASQAAPPGEGITTCSTAPIASPPHLPTLPVVPGSFSLLPNFDTPVISSQTTISSDPTRSNPPLLPTTTVPPLIPHEKFSTKLGNYTSDSIDLGQVTSSRTDSPLLTATPTVPGGTVESQPSGSVQTWTTTVNSFNLTGGVPVTDANTVSYCQASDSEKPKTSYSVVYTSTTTWTENPTEYTPPFPPMTTPSTCVDGYSPARLTVSVCTATGTETVTCTTALEWAPITQTHVSTAHATVTFVTTDKNPSVVYSSISTPDYGATRPGSGPQDLHNSVTDLDSIVTPSYVAASATQGAAEVNPSPSPSPSPSPTPSPVTVAPQPSGVVINGHTFSDNPASPTQTVVVGQETLTVDPSQVIGAGVTIDRASLLGGVFIPQPTSTNIGGVDVSISSSVAVLDGTSFTLGQTPLTTTVKGQDVTLGPAGVVVGTQTIAVTSLPAATQIVIAGGELVTAIGQSVFVIQGTTITYGPASSGITVVGGDSITLGPNGVTIHGTTLGGVSAKSTDTQFEIVGGATITEVGPSMVVIEGTTFTVGPGTGTTTTVIKGQTITIAPSGVVVSTATLPYPFGPTTTITPTVTPGGTPTPTTAEATGPTADPTPSKDAAVGTLPPGLGSILCIALGLAVWGL